MKTRFFAFYTLSAFAALSIGVLAATSGGTKQLPSRVSADTNYRLELLKDKNIIPDKPDGDGSAAVTLNTGNQITLNYSKYYHHSEWAWGRLYDGGYFENTTGIGGKISGLTSIEYNIAGKLKIEYGFDNYGEPYYYSDTLADGTVRGTFSFDATVGYPDRFKIISEGNTVIGDISFNYSCTESIAHKHVDTDVIGRTGSTGSYVYKHICDICGEAEGSVEDLSGYKVTLDGHDYTPYDFDTYSGIGELDFDYNETIEPGNKRFILTINGDHKDTDLKINSNQTDASSSQIYIKAENDAKVHDITFLGGNGVLLFIGDTLTFNNGNLVTEAKVTSVKGKLSFKGDKSRDAITVSNGTVYLENDVTIEDYNVGVRLSRNITGRDLHQTGGTFTVKNTDRALVSKTGYQQYNEYDGVFYLGSTALFENCTYALSFGASFDITGNVTIRNCEYGTDGGNVVVKNYLFVDGCYHGLHHTNIQVGNDESNGKLKINVNSSKSSYDSRAYGILVGAETINFKKGGAAIFSDSWNFTNGIEFANGLSNKFSVSEGFKFGFGNLGWAAKHSGDPDGTDKSNVKGTCITFAIDDMTWGANPNYKLVSNDTASSNEELLNKVFG